MLEGLQRRNIPRVRGWAAIVLSLSFFSTGCNAEGTSKDYPGSFLHGKCTITSGSHAGFEIGISKQNAFENSCQRAEQKKIWDPVFYTDGVLKAHPDVSMCELEAEATASNKWSFIEDAGWRERYIQLDFVDDKVETIILQPRGLDP